MADRRAIQVLDEWRELERQMARDDATELERARLVRRVADLRAEYHALTRRADGYEELPPPTGAPREDSAAQFTAHESVTGAG